MEKSKFSQALIRKGIISGVFAGLTVGAFIGIGIANDVVSTNEGFIAAALCSVETDAENVTLGDKLAVQIEEEGLVLAKNDDNTLPFSRDVTKVNVFGHSVVDWLISNSGSGSSGPGSAQKSIGLLDALESYGIEYNTNIIDYYKSWCAPRSLPFSINCGYNELYRLADPQMKDFQATYDAALDYSDTAIVCLSRVAGEHIDPPHQQINNYKAAKTKNTERGYLELTEEEEDLLYAVGQDYEHVVVIINSSNVMQMDFMTDIEGLDSCLLVGPTGTVGATAIPKVLYGDVNPSGRTADTWPMKHWYNPTYYTSGNWPSNNGPYYTGAPSDANLKTHNGQAGVSFNNVNFADYQEGIYVGYRWWETADKEGFWEANGLSYEDAVAYPFGHGLSYTSFEWEFVDCTPGRNSSFDENTEFTFKVKVTNTGEVTGRDVVELYLTAPYYEDEIEKPYVKLIGFQKTARIAPGHSDTVEIKAYGRDFMSFDCYDSDGNDFAGWEIDRGEYEVKFMQSAHVMKEGIAPVKFRIGETINVENDTHTGEPVKPIFTGDDAIDGISCDGLSIGEDIHYLTRTTFNDFVLERKNRPNANRAWNSELEVSKGKTGAKAPNAYSRADATAWDNATGEDAFGHPIPEDAPQWGNDSGIRVLDANGQLTEDGEILAANYDDELWDTLLDQVKWEESVAIVNGGSESYYRRGVKSVGLRNGAEKDYHDVEAASQVGVDLENKTRRLTAYPTPTVQAQCWNTTMPYLFGLSEAKDMIIGGADASYGPASNIHRSPYGGRSSEYHSEDGFLAGVTLANVTRGLTDGGKSGFIKHFAANDTEYHRVGLYTWLTEQALREIYLRPFEEAIKRGQANALMTAFNRVGATWTGGSQALCQGVLRYEWGFKGMTITDMIESDALMDAQQHFRAGNNYILGGSWSTGTGSAPTLAGSSIRLQNRMRENAKQVIYAHIRCLYNNKLYNENPENAAIVSGSRKPMWLWYKPLLWSAEALVLTGLILGIVLPWLPSDPEYRAELKARMTGKKKED